MSTITGSEFLARSLSGYGLTHAFMVPTVALRAMSAMEELGVHAYTTHGEKAAAYMADGYARVRRAPGVCFAQTIGSANLAAGLRDPYMAGSPVVALTGGRTPLTKYKNVYQEIYDFPLYESVTKLNVQCDDVRRLPDLLRQAFRAATSGAPGPVHVEIQGLAAEILEGEIDLDLAGPYAEERFARCPAFRPEPEPEAVRAALELLARAERPVVVAGGGVVTSGAQRELVELAEKLSLPVATSLNAKGAIDETHPLAVGVVGSYSRASANRAVAEADLVFFVGSHTGSQVTDNWRLPAVGTPVIQLDIDPLELGHNYPNTVSLLGDAGATLRRLSEQSQPAARESWLGWVRDAVSEWRTEKAAVLASDADPIRPERLCKEVTDWLPDDGVLLCDTGHAGIWVGSMIDMKPTQSFLRCAGSLGWAFPASLGAKCGAPERPVVCFTGDGGFYYHLSELETAARYGIEAVIVVNNNDSLSQDWQPYEYAYQGEQTELAKRMWTFEKVNLARVAEDLGCRGIRVDDAGNIREALEEAHRGGGLVVVDVATDIAALPDPPHGGRPFYSASQRPVRGV